MQLVAYLNFAGNCRQAFEFYQEVLGGDLVAMITQEDMGVPTEDEATNGHIMHARLVIGDQVLMGSDVPGEFADIPAPVQVSIHVDTAEEAERTFGALARDATVHIPLEEQVWAERFGFLTDRFGIPWMINCEKPMQ